MGGANQTSFHLFKRHTHSLTGGQERREDDDEEEEPRDVITHHAAAMRSAVAVVGFLTALTISAGYLIEGDAPF